MENIIVSKYRLEPYSGGKSRHICPNCHDRSSFTYYVDRISNEPINENCGRCNKESSCGYHLTPKEYFERNGITNEKRFVPLSQVPKEKPKDVFYIPHHWVERSFSSLEQSELFQFFERLITRDEALKLFKSMSVGANKNCDTIFWQVDYWGNVRSGHIMPYCLNGHRDKSEGAKYHYTWAENRLMDKTRQEVRRCFFNEVSLRGNNKPIIVVESEKTCLIGSMYLPQFNWIATGSSGNISKLLEPHSKLILQNRNVILYPDQGGFEKWNEKANEAKKLGLKVRCLDEMEKHEKGTDIADLLLVECSNTHFALIHDYPLFWDL